MEFRLLGLLEVVEGERRIPIDAPKQRALLALLLLHRGQAVSVERLADELWGEHPPATATKTVQVYVAQLRKALGHGLLVTHGRSYALAPEGHVVDVERFERLSAEGGRQLESGDPKRAAETLGEALALWRGPALADFAYDEFAQSEIARLEELRLEALATRVEADLALGCHEQVMAELHELVHRYPLRERFHAQLMLALYRSGRQAEALEAYRIARHAFVEELGLEPGRELQELERAILAQDESIEAPRRMPARTPRRSRRGALLALSGVLVLAAAAAALALELTRRGGGGISSVIPGNSLAAVDPGTGQIVEQIPVGATPTAVSFGQGAVWVLNADDQTISRVDPGTNAVRTLGIGAIPTDVAAGAGGVWVGNGGKLGRSLFAGSTATALTRLDAATGAVRATVSLPKPGTIVSNAAAQHIAFARGSVWAIAPDFSVVRIDPAANRIVARVSGVSAVAIAGGPAGVWVLNDDGTVARLGVRRNAVTARIKVPATTLTSLAVGAGSVWATDPYAGTVWRIDPGTKAVQRTIDVGRGVDFVAFGNGAVWVSNSALGTLQQVDPATNRIARTIAVGNTPRAVAVGGDLVWVAVSGGVGRPPAGEGGSEGSVEPLAESNCGLVVSGSDRPRFLIASDLPLRGGPRFPTLQMSNAILDVLRRHSFHAGPYPLGYQSCDDSTAQTGLYDEAKCAANAKAYGADRDVLGVIGPFNSGCALPQIPIANRAGLAMVSPTNSDPGLTRLVPGLPRDALASLYPTGRRNYVRLMSPDDAQAAAAAVLARRLGAETAFVLDDGLYGPAFALHFKRAAEHLGVRVVGSARWNPKKLGSGAPAESAARSGADAVYLCGLIDTGVGEVLATLGRVLPSRVVVIGCDGFLPADLLFRRAGRAARGAYALVDGLVSERFPPAGRRFLREFGATQRGGRVDPYAVYAAEATEVLLAAIGRSDGSRESVVEQLFRTRMRDGLLGTFAVDANGDAVPSPITVVRLERGGGSNAILSYEGARVIGVIEPSRSLFELSSRY